MGIGMSGILVSGVLMGIGATVAMDIWAVVLNRVAGIGLPNWGNVGRWVAHLPRWQHDDIGAVAPVQQEATIGWVFHYAVGVAYGVIFALIVGASWLANPTFLPAWVFAILTIAAGWFILQPGLGAGWAASRTPTPWKARGLGMLAHTVFGVGLWVVALVV